MIERVIATRNMRDCFAEKRKTKTVVNQGKLVHLEMLTQIVSQPLEIVHPCRNDFGDQGEAYSFSLDSYACFIDAVSVPATSSRDRFQRRCGIRLREN